MTASLDKHAVLAQLTPDQVVAQYGFIGRWQGRWLRSRRCPQTLHGTDAFGLSREGSWHCHGCDVGGADLLSLIALAESLDCRTQFGAVLEIAASIAGVEPEDDFGPTPVYRRPAALQPPPITQPSLRERLITARRCAEWVWSHLRMGSRTTETGSHWYLATRGLPWAQLPDHARINVRDLGFWIEPGDYDQLVVASNEVEVDRDERQVARAIKRIYSSEPGVAVAVRHIETGNLCDVRARRAEPKEGEPKILGMPGGVTVHAQAHGTDLVACYGHPHRLEHGHVIVVEGWADYLTACLRWPKADVLGAVDAGSYPLVASFAARHIAERGGGRLVLVAQDDGDGKAADRAVNAAVKRATALLGPRVEVLEARVFRVKDLNELAQAGRLNELTEDP